MGDHIFDNYSLKQNIIASAEREVDMENIILYGDKINKDFIAMLRVI